MKRLSVAVLLLMGAFCWGCVSSPDDAESDDFDSPESEIQGVGGLSRRTTYHSPEGIVCRDSDGDGVWYCTDSNDPESPVWPTLCPDCGG